MMEIDLIIIRLILNFLNRIPGEWILGLGSTLRYLWFEATSFSWVLAWDSNEDDP